MRSSPGQMHIGWDLDDVTTNLTEGLLRLYALRTGVQAAPGDVLDWSFFPREIHDEMMLSGYSGLKAKPGAAEALKKLKAGGDRVSIITYRNAGSRSATLGWLEENIPGLYDGLYMAGGSKAAICAEIGVDVLVDDSARQAMDVSRAGIHAIVYATPMNRGVEEAGLVSRAEGYGEVLERIEILRIKLKGNRC